MSVQENQRKSLQWHKKNMSAPGKNECWRKNVMSGPEKNERKKHKIEATDVKNSRQEPKKHSVNGWSFLLLTGTLPVSAIEK